MTTMRTGALTLLIVLATLASSSHATLDAAGLIEAAGLPAERHWVESSDGFVLGMFRIPRKNAPVAFLQHGFLDSADTWILNYRNNSLAFMLYDAGFDVWLGNSRGNKYSRNSTKYSPDWPFNSAFWDFSWDDMARDDMPTQIDYALSVSGRDKVVYIGHSQGTTQAFANFAHADWDVSDRVSLFVALAPVGKVYSTKSLLIQAMSTVGLDRIIQFLGVKEFLPTSSLLRWLMPTVCQATPLLCESAIYLFAGLDLGDLDKSRMPIYMQHFPSGTSCKDAGHWAQGVRHDEFQMYDYVLTNMLHYGQLFPPQYDVSKVRVPVALFSGGQDALADTTDVKWLHANLPNIVFNQYIPSYAHLDFVWGKNAATKLYNNVVQLAKQYSGSAY